MSKRALFLLAALPGFAATSQAGVINGRVIDTLGNGVPGVNISVSGGATIANGGTDPNGFFSATISPDGTYDVAFEPPTPPTTTLLTTVLEDLAVSGTVNLGDVVLQPGVSLSGRAIRAVGGAPVPAVNLDVVVGGQELLVPGDVTNASGLFSIAVPTGPLELRFDPEGAAGSLLAPTTLELAPVANTNIGDVALEPGFVMSAIVKRQSNGAGVLNADVDVFDSTTKEKMFTPGDNTDSAGFVDVVVPAGTFDFEICPQFADLLVAETLTSQVVTGNVFLGTVLLANGVVLSGHVDDFQGGVHAQVDVDLSDSTSGASVTLCADNTDSNGNYAIVVPTGTFDVEFEAPPALLLCPMTVFDVVIGGNTTLNATLPQGAMVYCTSKPSSVPGCVPSIVAPCTASLSGGPGSSDILCGPTPGGPQPGILVYTTNGAAATPANTAFGFMCVQTGAGFFRVVPPKMPGGTTGTCTGTYVFDFGAYLAGSPPDPNLVPGAIVDAQAWYRDPPNPGMANLSNASSFQLAP